MSTRVDSAAFWTSKAEGYAKSKIKDIPAYERTLAATQALIGPEDSVLELGAGTGTTALRLAGAARRYVASDLAKGMTDIARAKAEKDNIRLEVVTSGVQDAPKGPFDRVLSFNLLHLLPDLEADLKAIHARMAPGGLFISKTVCQPQGGGASFFFRFMMVALPVMQFFGKAPFVSLRPIAELEALIQAAGFEIVTSENHNEGPPSRFIVARRL